MKPTQPLDRLNALPLAGCGILELKPFVDRRGSFTKLFDAPYLRGLGLAEPICQINLSVNGQKGTLRGLHFQYPPMAETRLVFCLRGAIYDVLVDIRSASPTFLRWHAVELSQNSSRVLMIAPGMAHGFITLEPETHLLYMHTGQYHPGCEGGLRYDDPRLNIAWPLPPQAISERDKGHPYLDGSFVGIKP